MLFCDLVQSTQLANLLDPDDLRIVFASLHRVVREVTRRHSGYVLRFAGDGAFVVFGYPAAQEDAAESAVRAGLDFVQSMRGVRTAVAPDLEMRVGIASGQIVMGDLIDGAGVDERSVTGPIAHLAARLVLAAPPGGVVLCEDTLRLIGRRFELQELGALSLEGFPGPTKAWRAVAESSGLSRFEALRAVRPSARLVGRDELLREVVDLWGHVLEGRGQAVELIGDAGIGKSRVVRALQQWAVDGPVLQLDLHCTPRTRNSPLYPVGVLLRRLAAVQAGDDQAAVIGKTRVLLAASMDAGAVDNMLRYVRGVVWSQGPAESTTTESPELERERTIGLLAGWVRTLAERSPVLLVVEDLHWSDATTLRVLQRVIGDATDRRLMVVMTRRDEGEALHDVPALTRMRLEPLGRADSQRLIRQLSAADSISAEAIEVIVARAEGNPLFLEELTRAALDARTSAHVSIPATLQNVIQARIDRLPDIRPLVQAAAVLGREFPLHILERLSEGEAGATVPALVGRLLEEGILVTTDAASYGSLRFRHVLIHDAVYQTLLRSDRQRLHARAASLLEGVHGVDEVPPDVLAHHWAQANQMQRAAECLIEASRTTASRAAYEESISHAQAGLRFADQVDDEAARRRLRRTLLAQVGHSRTAIHGYAAPAVETAFAEAMQVCDDATDPEELYPIVRGLGTYYLVRGRIARAGELARQCVQLAERAGRSDLSIDALAFFAYPAYYNGRLHESHRALVQCLSLYEAEAGSRFAYPNVQEPATAAWSLMTTIEWQRGNLLAADRAALTLMAHLERLQRPFDDTFGKVWLAASCLLRRRFDRAREHARAGLAVARQHGFGTWIPAATMQLCIARGAAVAAPEAMAMLQQLHRGFLAAGAEISFTYYAWGIALTLDAAGDREGARRMARNGLEFAQGGEETYMTSELHLLLSRLDDDGGGAAEHLAAALHHARSQGALTVALRAAALMAAQSPSTEERARARAVLAVLDGSSAVPDDPAFVQAALDAFHVG